MDEEELTAYHEAGHVVMAIQRGGEIVRASIEPPNDDGPKRYGETITAWKSFSELEISKAEIAVSLGGPVAEMIYVGEDRDVEKVPEWQADWIRAGSWVRKMAQNESQAHKLLARETAAVRQYLASPNGWAAVAAIADLLLAFETIEHEQCFETVEFWLPG